MAAKNANLSSRPHRRADHWISLGGFLLLSLGTTGLLFASNWPEFRGPTGQGYAEGSVPTTWSETEHVKWKTPIPGVGWSSPVIWKNQIWMTTSTVRAATEEEKAAAIAAAGGSADVIPLEVASDLRMRAICIDRDTGTILHDILLLREATPEPIHTMNSYASPTPVIEEGRVYCHFGSNGTAAVDTATGKIAWTNRELKLKHETGAGSSPILWKDLLIVHCDGSDTQAIAALHKSDGKLAWKTPRSGEMHDNPQFKKAYGTPLVITMGDQEVLISTAPDWLYGYDPATGKELWKVPYGSLGFSNVPRPIARDGVLYICTGFTKSQLMALEYGNRAASAEPTILWQFAKQVPQIASPLLIDGQIYFVSDQGGVFTSVDAKTGELIYQERLGGNHAASPIFADGKIYLPNREGTTHVIQPGRTLKVLAENELDSGCLASPVALDGMLFLRTQEALYRIE